MTQRETMRHQGLWVPAHDVPAHLACGWRLAPDEAGGTHPDRRVLLEPPAELSGEEAA